MKIDLKKGVLKRACELEKPHSGLTCTDDMQCTNDCQTFTCTDGDQTGAGSENRCRVIKPEIKGENKGRVADNLHIPEKVTQLVYTPMGPSTKTMKPGKVVVTARAQDKAGNQAAPCKFTVRPVTPIHP